MTYQSIVENAKARAGTLLIRSGHAANISGKAAKQAGAIVSDSFRAIANDHTAAARDFFSSMVSGYEKARADGMNAVVRKPIAYLPTGDRFMAAWKVSMSNLSKTGSELVGTLRAGVAELRVPFKTMTRAGVRARPATRLTRTHIRLVRNRPKAPRARPTN